MSEGPIVFIGNWERYKTPPNNGFGIFRLDADTGALTQVGSAAPDITVGAACLHPTRDILYCVDEYVTLPGYFLGGGGQVFAFAIDAKTGALTEIGHWPSFGALPSYLTTDKTGRFLVVTHHTDRTPVTKILGERREDYRITLDYDDAATVLFRLDADAPAPSHVFMHSGDGGPLAKQTHPQLHSVVASPSGELFAVCDKGNDEIHVIAIDVDAQRLVLRSTTKTPPGSSPRYSAFHPHRPFLFVNHETKAMVSAYRYSEDGSLTLVSSESALPPGQADSMAMQQSDIRVHPSGKHLYSMVRGLNGVSRFAIDEETGDVAWRDMVTLDGEGPRACAISPDGQFMIVAAWGSKDVLVWAIGPDGALSPTGYKVSQPNPGTVTFYTPGAPRPFTA
jgi:6-phosphogluconolactonase (cycloisomerase 2 family)